MPLRIYLLLISSLLFLQVSVAQGDLSLSQITTATTGCTANRQAELPALVTCLLGEVTTDEAQLRQLAYWVADNIAYDVDRQRGQPQSCEDSTLKYKRGHCSDYAALFQDMCTLAGFESHVVAGYTKPWGARSEQTFTQPDHAWNVVVLPDTVLLFDLTWAAGVVNKEGMFEKGVNPAMILADPALFLQTHLAADPRWQLRTSPIPIAQFEGFGSDASSTEAQGQNYSYQDSITAYQAADVYDRAIMTGASAYRFHPTHANFQRWLTNTLHQCNLIWENSPGTKDYQRTIRICQGVHQLATNQPDFPQQQHFQERALLGIKYARYMLKTK